MWGGGGGREDEDAPPGGSATKDTAMTASIAVDARAARSSDIELPSICWR